MTKKLDHDIAALEMQAAGLTPLEPYPGNKSKWLCLCNTCKQQVRPTLASVRNNGGGCRSCGLKKSAKSRMIDEQVACDLMRSAGATPLEPFPGSNRSWLCKCQNCERNITPRLSNVKQGHSPCAHCSGKKVDPDEALNLMVRRGLLPVVPYPGANKPWKSQCQACESEIFPRYTEVKSGAGCRICGYRKGGAKQKLNEVDCIALFESKGLTPLVPYPGSGKPWLSKCTKCGFEVSPTYNSVLNGSGCAVCGKRQIAPEAAIETMLNANLQPLVPFPGGKQSWNCKCLRCGKSVSPKYTDIQSGYGGCKYCGGHYVDPEAAVLLMMNTGLVPQVPYKASGTSWHCICQKCGRDVFPTYNSVQQGGSGCGYCAKRKVLPADAARIMQAAGVEPLVGYPGARIPWHCRCKKCGLEVYPIYSSIANQGHSACVFCAGKKVDAERAFSLMIGANLSPLEPYRRADQPWKCTCNKCGRLVTPTYTSIRIGQGGCKYCAEKGLDFAAPTFLYLMENQEFFAIKIGIGNLKTKINRIAEHQKNGWVLLKRVDFISGDIAYKVEQSVLNWARNDLGLLPCLTSKEMPQRGWTETLDSHSVDSNLIWKRVLQAISELD